MATLGELKTRIYEECNSRTYLEPGVGDLSGSLTRAIERAIEFYADEKFWFNAYQETEPTIASQDYIDKPAAVRRIETITLPAEYVKLREVSLSTLYEARLSGAGESSPRLWAEYDDDIKFYPTPDAVYTLQLVGIADIGVPATDGASNDWTTYGQDLIAARARFVLYRDQFRDIEGASVAQAAADEALRRLRRDTAKRLKHPLSTDVPVTARRSFDINSGW